MLRHTVFLCHTTRENKIQTLSFGFFFGFFFSYTGLCNNHQEGGQKMSFARRNFTQYPPLNKSKLALTPLQISQKLCRTHPSPA